MVIYICMFIAVPMMPPCPSHLPERQQYWKASKDLANHIRIYLRCSLKSYTYYMPYFDHGAVYILSS